MKTLSETRVRDLMQVEVVTVRPGTSVREVTRILSDHEISGAPVVDGNGRILGVVSATDVLRLAAEETEVRVPAFPDEDATRRTAEEEDEDEEGYAFFLETDRPRGARPDALWLGESELDERAVEEIMTPVHFSVRPDATLAELAAFLLRGRIHRALVVEEGRLLGIVTSFDILRAVTEE